MPTQTPPPRNRALRRSVMTALVLVSIVPLALATWMVRGNLNDTLTRLVHQGLRESASRHSASIDDFLHRQLALLSLMATSQGEALLDNANFQRHLPLLKAQASNALVDMGIVDPKGRQRRYAGPLTLEDADYSKADWFQEFYKGNAAPFISDVFVGLRNSPHFIVVTPLPVGDEIWALRATVDFGRFSRLVENLKPGENGDAYIINSDGMLQTPALQATQGSSPVLSYIERRIFEDAARNSIARTTEDATDIYAVAPIKNKNWLLVLRLSRESAYANTQQMWQVIIFALVVMSLVMLTLGIVLVIRILARFEHLSHEREALQQRLMQASKLSALGEMAAGVAHEINNPLAAMREEAGWAQDMLAELPPSANTREIGTSLEKILHQIVRCKNITHEMLGFARKPDTVDTHTQLPALIHEIVAQTDQKARKAGVTLHLDLPSTLPPVKGATGSLQQVFANLFNNAIDAMTPSGGELRVSAMVLPAEKSVEVRVEDTGSGMQPEVMERIFDPFFSTKEKNKGTGLGLSICYGIIKGVGGEITVESTPGQGTCFTLILLQG